MILDIFFTFANLILSGLIGVMNTISFLVPSQIQDGISTILSYGDYAQNFFPFDQLLLGASTYLTFWTAKYTLKIIVMAVGSIPFASLKLPTLK